MPTIRTISVLHAVETRPAGAMRPTKRLFELRPRVQRSLAIPTQVNVLFDGSSVPYQWEPLVDSTGSAVHVVALCYDDRFKAYVDGYYVLFERYSVVIALISGFLVGQLAKSWSNFSVQIRTG